MTMHDPFGRSRLPAAYTREQRVALLHEAALAMLAGETVAPEAARLLGGALCAWLTHGGSLEHRLQVKARRGSHRTPAAVLRQVIAQAERTSAVEPAAQTRTFRAGAPHRDERQSEGASIG